MSWRTWEREVRWLHDVFWTSWRTSRLHDALFEAMTCFGRHDELFTSWRVLTHLLASWRTFYCMTFWRHDALFDIMTCFGRHDTLFDIMTCFWRHDFFDVRTLFNVIMCFWRHDKLFDFMKCFWRHDELFDVITNWFFDKCFARFGILRILV